MDTPVVTEVEILKAVPPLEFVNSIDLTFSDGSVDEAFVSYHSEDVSFAREDFLGLTRDQCEYLVHNTKVCFSGAATQQKVRG